MASGQSPWAPAGLACSLGLGFTPAQFLTVPAARVWNGLPVTHHMVAVVVTRLQRAFEDSPLLQEYLPSHNNKLNYCQSLHLRYSSLTFSMFCGLAASLVLCHVNHIRFKMMMMNFVFVIALSHLKMLFQHCQNSVRFKTSAFHVQRRIPVFFDDFSASCVSHGRSSNFGVRCRRHDSSATFGGCRSNHSRRRCDIGDGVGSERQSANCRKFVGDSTGVIDGIERWYHEPSRVGPGSRLERVAVLRHGLFKDVRLQASLKNVPLCEVPVLTATLLRSRHAVFDLVQCSRRCSLYDTLIIFMWWWWWWVSTHDTGWWRGSVVRISVFGWRTFPDLRPICGWRMTTSWVKYPLWVNQPCQLNLPSLQVW